MDKRKFEDIDNYFSNLSDEEFRKILIDAGFEVSDGDGKIIFNDEYNENKEEIKMDKEKIKNEVIEIVKRNYVDRGIKAIQSLMNNWDEIIENTFKKTNEWTKEELENLKQDILIEIEKLNEKNEI